MAIVKLDAITALVAAISAAVPALNGKITVHQAVPSKVESFPNLAIVLAGRFPFEPHQRALEVDLGGNVVVWNVGAHSGPVQWRVSATTSKERIALEAALIDFAMSRIGSPGIVVVPVVASAQLTWVAAFEYEDSTWMDQRAQEREYEAVLTFTGVFPALVTESPVYDTTTLLLGLTQDFATAFTPSTFPSVGLVRIHDDGTVTPA